MHTLFDVHGWFNNIDSYERESIYEYSKKCINLCTTLGGLLQYVDGYKVIDFYEILDIDY